MSIFDQITKELYNGRDLSTCALELPFHTVKGLSGYQLISKGQYFFVSRRVRAVSVCAFKRKIRSGLVLRTVDRNFLFMKKLVT